MDVLPPRFSIIDTHGQRISNRSVPERVDAPDDWTESDWDRIIVENVDVLAAALREAGVVPEGATLMVLATQIDNIDVVLAEVSDDDRRELRRLVLLEDKLLSNGEARRQVLAQILDYSRAVQEDWPTANLVDKFRSHAAWISKNDEELRRSARAADFLLLVAGDGIDQGMERLARRFSAHDDPLSLSELALVSMPLYELDGQFLLVPHVVSTVQRQERGMTLRVVVQDVQGREIAAEPTLELSRTVPTGALKRPPVRDDVGAFLRGLQPRLVGLLPGARETGKPRKALEYLLTLPDGGPVVCKVHFGGYVRDLWSPIFVGIGLTAPDSAARDAWAERLTLHLKAMPAGTKVKSSGERSVEALKEVPWTSSSDLTPALAEALTSHFTSFTAVLPLLLQSAVSGVAGV